MATPPNRLQIGTSTDDSYALINDNFENVVQDIRDLGANVSTILSKTITVPSSSLTSFVVTLTSLGVTSTSANQVITQKPVSNVSGISPQLDIYVDTKDLSYLFPLGTSLTSGQLLLFPICTILNTGFANSVGAYLIQINNRDTISHDYIIDTLCGYFPTGTSGIFR